MPNLALITPWPPQASGIADYAFDLAIGLSEQDAHVTVFTDERAPTAPGRGVRVRHLSEFPGPGPFDHTVFQLGNHPQFHGAMLPLLAKHGGLVHLHDLVLHPLIAFYTCGQGNRRLYQQLLQRWYGTNAVDRFLAWSDGNRKRFWDSVAATEFPLFEPFVRFAQGCIVHSQFAHQRVSQRLPEQSCAVIPQAYRNTAVAPAPDNVHFRIGVFGGVQPHKHVDKGLRAIARCVAQGADIELEVVGDVDPTCETLPELAADLGLQHRINWHGRTEVTQFLQIMQSVDLCLALRCPTMGETSGVVSRMLQAGVPMIVNDVDWYAELPTHVGKVPTDPGVMQSALDSLIARHVFDTGFHRQTRHEAAQHAHTRLDFASVCARYLEILNECSPVLPAVQRQELCSAYVEVA